MNNDDKSLKLMDDGYVVGWLLVSQQQVELLVVLVSVGESWIWTYSLGAELGALSYLSRWETMR